ncbi:MAG: thiamine biosynthesis protein ThiS [Nanohaloarchaea archaeon]|nr:thiamine biosynthesis protein ThiS [Candidatus Nanohaloarchaea archaeon]
MDIEVTYEGKKNRLNFDKVPKVSELMDRLDINKETVLVKINSEIEPEDIRIKKEDEIEMIKIISGG